MFWDIEHSNTASFGQFRKMTILEFLDLTSDLLIIIGQLVIDLVEIYRDILHEKNFPKTNPNQNRPEKGRNKVLKNGMFKTGKRLLLPNHLLLTI
jgi:Zn-finger domain-containing protein